MKSPQNMARHVCNLGAWQNRTKNRSTFRTN